MTPSDVESGGEPVGSQPPAPAVSIARPSRRPKGVASMVTTVPSGSPVGSIVSPWRVPMGLLLAVAVTSAAVDDAAAAPKVLGQLTRRSTSLEEVVGEHQVPQSRPEPMGLEERVVCH